MISEKLNYLAERKVAHKICELSNVFKDFIDTNNLKDDMVFVSDATGISEDDLNDFYYHSPDCDINPYSLNLYYKMYYLLNKCNSNTILKEIQAAKSKWDEDDNINLQVTASSFEETNIDKDGNKTVDSHATIKAMDNKSGNVIETNAKNIEDASREFINKINDALGNKNCINVDEALNAKKVFDKDVNSNSNQFKYNNPVKDKVSSDYESSLKEAQMELFGDTEMLDSKTIGMLRYYIIKNGWDKEIDNELMNNRQSVLLLLYNKLQECMNKKLKEKNNITESDMENFKKSQDVAKKEYKKQMDSVNTEANKINKDNVKSVSISDVFKILADLFKD